VLLVACSILRLKISFWLDSLRCGASRGVTALANSAFEVALFALYADVKERSKALALDRFVWKRFFHSHNRENSKRGN